MCILGLGQLNWGSPIFIGDTIPDDGVMRLQCYARKKRKKQSKKTGEQIHQKNAAHEMIVILQW